MSLTLVLTRHASITSVLPVSGRPATRGAPSSKSLVSSDGEVCVREIYSCVNMVQIVGLRSMCCENENIPG